MNPEMAQIQKIYNYGVHTYFEAILKAKDSKENCTVTNEEEADVVFVVFNKGCQ